MMEKIGGTDNNTLVRRAIHVARRSQTKIYVAAELIFIIRYSCATCNFPNWTDYGLLKYGAVSRALQSDMAFPPSILFATRAASKCDRRFI